MDDTEVVSWDDPLREYTEGAPWKFRETSEKAPRQSAMTLTYSESGDPAL